MINISNVTKRYANGFEALKNVSLPVGEGELVVITGPSGAGKSTLLKVAAGIEYPTTGNVTVAGQNISRLRPQALAILRRNIGLIFQDHKLLFDRNAFENVAFPLAINGYPRADAARRVRAALDKVGLLGCENANPIQLSGGEQQRLCIARAIVNRPAILIADEPTGNLDAEYAVAIMELFRSFNQVGVTILISTHDEALATRYDPRRFHLEKGQFISTAQVTA